MLNFTASSKWKISIRKIQNFNYWGRRHRVD